MKNKKNKYIVLFSGGIDSSLVSCKLAYQNNDIVLLHCQNGALYSRSIYKIRYKEIKDVFKDSKIKIQLVEKNIMGIFRKFALEKIEEDFEKYKKNLICVGCKLAMHIEAILYAKKNNILNIADGNVSYQSRYGEQSPTAILTYKKLYDKFDLNYLNPILEYSGEKQVKYELFEYGISMKSLEDTCLFSNTFTQANDNVIIDYLNKRYEQSVDYIKSRLNNLS